MIDTDIMDVINSIKSEFYLKYIPVDKQVDYWGLGVGFQDYISYDMLAYYAGVIKMEIFGVAGITAALLVMPKQNVIPISPKSDLSDIFLDLLDDNEFADQGYEMPVQTVEGKYLYHEVRTGETMQSIAMQYYSDVNQWKLIVQANGIRDYELIYSDMVGRILKIPIIGTDQMALRDAENLVYEKYNDETAEAYQKYLLGTDINLVNDSMMVVDASGDIGIVESVACAVANIEDRMRHVKGSMNPFHPDWGLESIKMFTELPYFIALERFFSDVEIQALDDPRIISAAVNRDTFTIEGDSITYEMTVGIIGNITEKISSKVA